MIGILGLITKTVAGMLFSSSAKNLLSGKKSNDMVSEIFNQFAWADGDKKPRLKVIDESTF